MPSLGMAFGKLEISYLGGEPSSVLRASFSTSQDSLLSLLVHSICEKLQFSLSHNSLPRGSPASHRPGPGCNFLLRTLLSFPLIVPSHSSRGRCPSVPSHPTLLPLHFSSCSSQVPGSPRRHFHVVPLF